MESIDLADVSGGTNTAPIDISKAHINTVNATATLYDTYSNPGLPVTT